MAFVDVQDEAPAPNEPLEQQAKEDRSAEAMVRLGLMFSTGNGVPLDSVQAHMWFNLAAMMGHEGAKEYRRQVADEMDPAQIAEAQRQAREWLYG